MNWKYGQALNQLPSTFWKNPQLVNLILTVERKRAVKPRYPVNPLAPTRWEREYFWHPALGAGDRDFCYFPISLITGKSCVLDSPIKNTSSIN